MKTKTDVLTLALAATTLFVLGRWPVASAWVAVFGLAALSFAGWLVGMRHSHRRWAAAGLLAAFVIFTKTSQSVAVYAAVPATSVTGIFLLVAAAAVIGLARPELGVVLGLVVAAAAVPAGGLLARPETWTVAEHDRSKVADGPVSRPSSEPGDCSGPSAPLNTRSNTYGKDAVPIPGTDVIVTYNYDTVRAVERDDLGTERWRHEYLPADGDAIDSLAVDIEGRRVVVFTGGVAVLLDAVTGQGLDVFPLPETADSWQPEKSAAGTVSHIILVDTSTLREVPVDAQAYVNEVATEYVRSIAAADGRLIVLAEGEVTRFGTG